MLSKTQAVPISHAVGQKRRKGKSQLHYRCSPAAHEKKSWGVGGSSKEKISASEIFTFAFFLVVLYRNHKINLKSAKIMFKNLTDEANYCQNCWHLERNHHYSAHKHNEWCNFPCDYKEPDDDQPPPCAMSECRCMMYIKKGT